MVVVPGGNRTVEWEHIERVLRRLSAVTVAGAALGLLVGGVGGRLAMMVLAGLNPQATGLTTDDGFLIGRFTTSGTLNLMLLTTVIGVVGGAIYLVLRVLLIGPRWFQILSVSVGPAVVVGSMIVHPGVDFLVLRPVALSVAVFLAIPWLYAALLTVVAERWLAPDGWFSTTRPLPALAPLVLWLPAVPVLVVLALGWFLRQLWTSHAPHRALPVVHRLARLALAVLFVTSTIGLIRTAADLL